MENIKENNQNNKLIKIKEFSIINNNILYRFVIIQKKEENNIIINCNDYEIKLTLKEIIKKTKLYLESIEEAFNLLINLFNLNKIGIKNSVNKKELIITLGIYNNILNKEDKILLYLTNENKEKEIIINDIVDKYNLLLNDVIKLKEENKKTNELLELLLNEITDIKKENSKIKNEINILKYNINKNNINNNNNDNENEDMVVSQNNFVKNKIYVNNNFNTQPNLINNSITLIKDAYGYYELDNIFIVFNSIYNISHIIYVKENNSIIDYNLNEQIIISEIKDAHKKIITNFKHYLDRINKRDIVMSISAEDCKIKLWNLNNWECILYLKDIYQNGCLFSACFINENNNNYIITTNCADISGFIKIYNFNGEKIKEIDNLNDETYFIDVYYDNIYNKIYIITGNKGYVKSYDYYNNTLYKKYLDNDLSKSHDCAIVNESIDNDGIINLVDSCQNGFISIWNFHAGILLHKINIGYNFLEGICLWNEKYLFVGGGDTTIKLIEIKNGLIIKSLAGHSENVLSIKKIRHSIYGESLISQGNDGNIKLWINNS